MSSLITRPARHRARFHTLTVTDVERLTDDAVAVSFAVPDDLADEYVFEPGQNLTLRATVDGRGALAGEIWSSTTGAARLQAVRNPDAVL